MKKVVLLAVLVMACTTAAMAADWKLVKEQDGIKVYTRDCPDTVVDEFKGVGIVDARIEVIAAVLRDVPNAVEWMCDTIYAEKVKQLEGENMIAFNVTKLPWPLQPRESLVNVKVDIDYKRGFANIDMLSIDDTKLKPVGKGHVRMTTVHAGYLLEYIDREHTRVTYTAKVDPAGIVPPKIANLVVVNLPYKTIKLLRTVSAKPKYVTLGQNSNDRQIIEKNIALGYLKP